jgi:hypothetical protein
LSSSFTGYGCPVYSASDVLYTEFLLVETHGTVARWQAAVASEKDYENPPVDVIEDPEVEFLIEDEVPWPEYTAAEQEQAFEEEKKIEDASAVRQEAGMLEVDER